MKNSKRKRTKSATWRKGVTDSGVEYYYALKPTHKAKDYQSPQVKGARASQKLDLDGVPTRPPGDKGIRDARSTKTARKNRAS